MFIISNAHTVSVDADACAVAVCTQRARSHQGSVHVHKLAVSIKCTHLLYVHLCHPVVLLQVLVPGCIEVLKLHVMCHLT